MAEIPQVAELDQDRLVLQGQPQVMDWQTDTLILDDHFDESEVVVLPEYCGADQTMGVDVELFAEFEGKAFILGELTCISQQDDELVHGQSFSPVLDLRGVKLCALKQGRRPDTVLLHEVQEVRYVP